jgi:hypothetical protein
MKKYKAKVGVNLSDGTRYEQDEVIEKITAKDAKGLLELDAIEEVEDGD